MGRKMRKGNATAKAGPAPREAASEPAPAEDAGQATGRSGYAVMGVTGLRDICRNTKGPQLYRLHRSDTYQGGQVLPSRRESLLSPTAFKERCLKTRKGDLGSVLKTQILP